MRRGWGGREAGCRTCGGRRVGGGGMGGGDQVLATLEVTGDANKKAGAEEMGGGGGWSMVGGPRCGG